VCVCVFVCVCFVFTVCIKLKLAWCWWAIRRPLLAGRGTAAIERWDDHFIIALPGRGVHFLLFFYPQTLCLRSSSLTPGRKFHHHLFSKEINLNGVLDYYVCSSTHRRHQLLFFLPLLVNCNLFKFFFIYYPWCSNRLVAVVTSLFPLLSPGCVHERSWISFFVRAGMKEAHSMPYTPPPPPPLSSSYVRIAAKLCSDGAIQEGTAKSHLQ